ncbi:uncharacterized protein LOC116846886 [Odontomachus brunneus]|uniref:uncharacterized protein LOC116846886 n=1 Tax=Odontomachus brunneus TaxID=486640 RepID=UPI0013F21B01|nr:uncharacterized protein LOC116846886 [Odontomachus brunneus]
MTWFENLKKYPVNYNKFFHPNVCHVCKWSYGDELKLCADCHMISYCGEEHRVLHREQHENMCKAIREMCKTKNLWDSRGMTSDQWLIFRKENVQVIQLILHRKLEPYEEQMFLFAKSCGICRQQDNLTSTCPNCFSVNTCVDHDLTDVKHDCHFLRTALWLDTHELENTLLKIPQSYMPNCMNKSFLVGGMKLFIDFCRTRDQLKFTWSANDYNYSDYLSKPLTVLNVISNEQLAFRVNHIRSFVIHIIDGIFTDTCSLSAWEVFLHTLNEGTELLIIMIGTEFKNIPWDVCDMCRAAGKKLNFEYRAILNEQHIQHLFYVESDLIVGFDADLRKFEASIIKALLFSQNCLLILTAKSKSNAQENIMKIKEVLGIKPTYFVENDFSSIRPYRDYENNTFSSNKYLIVYNDTYVRNDSLQAGSSHQV